MHGTIQHGQLSSSPKLQLATQECSKHLLTDEVDYYTTRSPETYPDCKWRTCSTVARQYQGGKFESMIAEVLAHWCCDMWHWQTDSACEFLMHCSSESPARTELSTQHSPEYAQALSCLAWCPLLGGQASPGKLGGIDFCFPSLTSYLEHPQ
jgi:hypothetical protein